MATPYRYSLFDDEEQLGSLLEPNTLQSLAPTAREMAPAQQQQRAPIAQAPAADPELDSAYRDLQLQKIHEAQTPSYGFAEGVRDVVPTGLALALDAAVNHGRGAAGILQGGLAEVAQQELRRDQQRKAAADEAIRMHGKGQDAAAAARLQYSYDALDARRRAADAVQGRFDQNVARNDDPNSQHNLTREAMAELIASAGSRGRLNTEHQLNQQTAGDKAEIRTAETEAELAAKHEGAPVANADAADRAKLEAEAKLPSQIAEKQTPTAADTRQAEQLALAQSAPPGFHVENEQAWRAFSADPTRRAAADQYLTKGETTRKALERMIELRSQLGPAWNTLGDAEKAKLLDEMALTQQGAVGGFTGIGALGVLNAGEFPRVGATMPNGSAAISDLYDPILTAFSHGSKRDTQLEQLQGTLNAFNQLYNSGLTQAGLAPGTSPAPAPNALPGEAVPADLGTTQGRVPPISTANGTVTVTLNGESKAVPRAVAQRMKQINPNLEISE